MAFIPMSVVRAVTDYKQPKVTKVSETADSVTCVIDTPSRIPGSRTNTPPFVLIVSTKDPVPKRKNTATGRGRGAKMHRLDPKASWMRR